MVGFIIAHIGYEKTYQLCAWLTIMTLFLYRWLCNRDTKDKNWDMTWNYVTYAILLRSLKS